MKSRHEARIAWRHRPHANDARTYSREHTVTFDERQSLKASASVDFKGAPDHVDPEQMLVSALASCHMLTFLALAELKGYRVETYDEAAVGFLEKVDGGMALSRIELSPQVRFGGEKQPDAAEINRLHAGAHRNCFIARSIKAEVILLPA